MINTEKKLVGPFETVALYGPLAIYSTAILILSKAAPAYVPLALGGCAGLFLCWQWRVKGLLVAVSGLLGLLLFQHDLYSHSPYWHAGLFISLCLAYIITTFSSDKVVEKSIGKIPQVPLAEIDELKSAHKTAEDKWNAEHKSLSTLCDQWKQKTEEQEMQIRVQETTLASLRKDLDATKGLHESLESDLCNLRHESKSTKKQLQDAENELTKLKYSENLLAKAEHQYRDLQNLLSIREKEISSLHEKLTHHEREASKLQKTLEDTLLTLNEERNASVSQRDSFLQKQQEAEKHFLHHQEEMQKLLSSLRSEEVEKEKLTLDLINQSQRLESLAFEHERIQKKLEENRLARRSEGINKQMRDQFLEKSRVLDATRKELFKTREELTALQLAQQESAFDRSPEQAFLEKQVLEMEKEYITLENENDLLTEIVANIHKH